MAWTRFFDVCSGGFEKTDYTAIYIEAPREEAEIVFSKRFDRDPSGVTCDCCGPDFAVSESPDEPDPSEERAVCVIRAEEIEPGERVE